MRQDGLRCAQDDPSWAQLGPKMLQDKAKMVTKASKMTEWAHFGQLGTKKPKHRSKIRPGRDDASSRQPCLPQYSSTDLQEQLQDTELSSYLAT